MANSPWLGKKMSEAHRKKISDGLRGRVCSKETREKIGRANSVSLLGNIPWNKGKKIHFEVWNKGTKGVCKPNSGSFKKGNIGHSMPHSKETVEKMRLNTQKLWREGKFDNRPEHTPETREKIRQTLRKGKFINCIVCGKEKWASPANLNTKFCSHICQGKHYSGENSVLWNKGMFGENNPAWKGGTSRGYKTGYYSREYKLWRKGVFQRDDYTCQGCGVKNTYLTAHHIKSFAKYPELRFDLNNGVTLCEDCHAEVDNYYARFRKKEV
jgi:hypothetical protein